MDKTASATNAAVSSAVTVLGIATGLSYEVLFAGFSGALCALSFLGAMSAWRRVWSLISSTLFAGYCAPIAYVWAMKLVPGDHAPLLLMVFTAYCCGISAQAAIPLFMLWVERQGQKKVNEVSP